MRKLTPNQAKRLTAPNRVVKRIVEDIFARQNTDEILLVAIDGVDGSGKTVFADKLSQTLEQNGVNTIHSSVDGFHKPKVERYRRGRHSPEGFYRDSYDYDSLRALLLEPLRSGVNEYITAIRDVASDTRLNLPIQHAKPNTVLIFDGIFLHRDELRDYWDYSVYLSVDFKTTFARMASRDGTPQNPHDEKNRRYFEGQLLYIQECEPERRATMVVDNTDYDRPEIITG